MQVVAHCPTKAVAADGRNVYFMSPPVAIMPCTLQNGSTPLHVASQNGHKDIAQLLLDHGAGVSIASKVSVSFLSMEVRPCC